LDDLHDALENLKKFASTHDAEGIKAELGKVIPEYTSQDSEAVLPPKGALFSSSAHLSEIIVKIMA
jgi:hypothetical protein